MRALAERWLAAKAAEAEAVTARREAEDALRAALGLSEALEGTETKEVDGYKVKVTGRINRKVDADKVQELAAEAGLSDHLSSLFRWSPSVNLAAWKATDSSITNVLAPAITAEPGRPSFSITKE